MLLKFTSLTFVLLRPRPSRRRHEEGFCELPLAISVLLKAFTSRHIFRHRRTSSSTLPCLLPLPSTSRALRIPIERHLLIAICCWPDRLPHLDSPQTTIYENVQLLQGHLRTCPCVTTILE